MKILILISLLCTSYCYAQFQFDVPPMASTRLGDDGTSSITQHYRNDNQGNYDYGYNEGHNQGGTFRRERGDIYGRKYGTYGYTTNEGLIRIVNYVADENGFRAELKSTEPGVGEQEPASVIVFKEDTPTLMTYPGPEAASVPNSSGNVAGFTAAAASTQYITAAASTPEQYSAGSASKPVQHSAESAPIPYSVPVTSGQPSANVMVNGQFGRYSYKI